MSKWNKVFDSHPDAKRIYVVGNQPFLVEKHAVNYARTQGVEVEVVQRTGAQKKDPETPTTAKTEGSADSKGEKPETPTTVKTEGSADSKVPKK